MSTIRIGDGADVIAVIDGEPTDRAAVAVVAVGAEEDARRHSYRLKIGHCSSNCAP
jgi:hypothetical protein